MKTPLHKTNSFKKRQTEAALWLNDLLKYMIKNGEWLEFRHLNFAMTAFIEGMGAERVATIIAEREYHRRARLNGYAAENAKIMAVTKRGLPSRTLVEAL